MNEIHLPNIFKSFNPDKISSEWTEKRDGRWWQKKCFCLSCNFLITTQLNQTLMKQFEVFWELWDRLSLPQCRVPHLCNSLYQEYDPKQQWRSWKTRWKTRERDTQRDGNINESARPSWETSERREGNTNVLRKMKLINKSTQSLPQYRPFVH